ncbi:MAG TPA: TetR/AcrR family transcriptional regulator [Sporichthyaceae bacterium]|jgi:AcrR family transcriptional regulator|nr:TetR/AcrR family transcriptional regulator [Sporichthyaceae bacterium]
MGGSQEKVRKGRLGREAYFNAAFKILATTGFQELTVDNLSAELGATKGSFYHHFAGMPEFTEALVAAWEARVSEIFTEMVALPPMEALARSMEMIQQWPLQADAALRSWAWANPVVKAAVRRQEAVWERLMVSWLEQVVPDPERCRLLAHMTLALLAGMMQLQHPPDADLINAVALELIHNNIGIELLPDGTQRPQDLTVEASPKPRRTGRRKTTSPAG